jgi:hypothetical protein
LASGAGFRFIPERNGYRPVNSDARVGAQYDIGQLKCVNRAPSAAIRSISGVLYFVCP